MKKDWAVKIENVSKRFKLPEARKVTIQSYFVNPFSRTKYNTFEPLKDVSCEIKKGEFFSIIGPNGAGKSTLLKIVAEIYEQDEGEVEINGRLVPFIELGVGFNPELTARENVYLNGILLGLTRKQITEHIDEIFEFAELEEFKNVPVKKFSSGMYVRLAFSIAIRVKSDILLLDEVLAVGDESFQKKCYEYFKKIKDKKTIIYVSHDLGSVEKYSDRVMYLGSNHSYEIGDPKKMIETYRKDSEN